MNKSAHHKPVTRREKTVLDNLREHMPEFFPAQINPGLAAMLARLREMAEDWKIVDDYENGRPTGGQFGVVARRCVDRDGRMPHPQYLRAAVDLLKILEGESK